MCVRSHCSSATFPLSVSRRPRAVPQRVHGAAGGRAHARAPDQEGPARRAQDGGPVTPTLAPVRDHLPAQARLQQARAARAPPACSLRFRLRHQVRHRLGLLTRAALHRATRRARVDQRARRALVRAHRPQGAQPGRAPRRLRRTRRAHRARRDLHRRPARLHPPDPALQHQRAPPTPLLQLFLYT